MQVLDGSTTLANGRRLRVRLPHGVDAAPLTALLERAGLMADELALARLLRFDPRGRMAVVATILVDRGEEIVGLGAIERFADAPELVIADEVLAPGAGAVLEDALRVHARFARWTA
jgi:hypothetical protein